MEEERITETVTDIIFAFLRNTLFDVDEIINYWGGDSMVELIFKGDSEE